MALLLAALPLIAGCESNRAAGRGDRFASYRIRTGDGAAESTRALRRRPPRPGSEEARFSAGIKAHRAGRLDEAERLLGPLTDSDNPRIAGRANATLGLIHAARTQYSQAALRFRRAIRTLGGEDRARAYYYLAIAEQKLGREHPARAHFKMAMRYSTDDAFHRTVRQRMSVDGYALQLGAFSSRDNAERQARAMRGEAASNGLGAPRVVPSTSSSGDRLYLVRVGRFDSFPQAIKARRRLVRSDAVITPTVHRP